MTEIELLVFLPCLWSHISRWTCGHDLYLRESYLYELETDHILRQCLWVHPSKPSMAQAQAAT